MHRSILFLFFALFATAFAAKGDFKPKQCGKGVKKTDVAAINARITEPKAFCDYYLSSKRTSIPISGQPFKGAASDAKLIKRFNNACECISKKQASTKAEKSIKRPGAKAKCVKADSAKLTAAVKQPTAFCKQWRSVAWRPANQTPFGKDFPVRNIYNACVCVIDKPAPKSSSTTTSSVVATTTTAKSSSSSSTTVSSSSATTTASSSSASSSASSSTVSADATSSATSSASTTEAATTTPVLVTSTSVAPTTTSSTAVASPTAAESGATKKKMAMRLRGRQYSNAGAGEVALE